MGHDLVQIEVIARVVSSQKQGPVVVKLQGHDGLVVSHEVSHNSGHFVVQVDLVLAIIGANLEHVQNGYDPLLALLALMVALALHRWWHGWVARGGVSRFGCR